MDGMAEAAGLSPEEMHAGWIAQVMADATDWALCPSCAARVETCLSPQQSAGETPAQEAVPPASEQAPPLKYVMYDAGTYGFVETQIDTFRNMNGWPDTPFDRHLAAVASMAMNPERQAEAWANVEAVIRDAAARLGENHPDVRAMRERAARMKTYLNPGEDFKALDLRARGERMKVLLSLDGRPPEGETAIDRLTALAERKLGPRGTGTPPPAQTSAAPKEPVSPSPSPAKPPKRWWQFWK